MNVTNRDVAGILDEVADLLDITGAGFFRVRAYRNASRTIRDLSSPLSRIESDPDRALEDLPGVGKDLAGRIREILDTGDLGLRRELESEMPPGLLDVIRVPGLGPRKAHELFLELGVSDLDSLEEAAKEGRVRHLKGFGVKTEQNILDGIQEVRGYGDRALWADAEAMVRSVLEHMASTGGLTRIEVAGSFRRLKETVGDLDFLASGTEPELLAERFTTHPDLRKVIARGPTRVSALFGWGLQVDMRVVDGDSFGAALQYFTGSQAHSVVLRGMALKRGLKLNEYGVFDGGSRVAGRTEESVYSALGLEWIPPELRENRGEIRAAAEGTLPALVELADLRGDLHLHTDMTDGRDSLEAMFAAARRHNYLYVAITDHTHRVSMVGGLDERGLLRAWEAIDALNEGGGRPRVLKGVEVDILADGSLDIPDEVLTRADYVVASIHYDRAMSRSQMTSRMVRAISNPLVDAIGHPTGRKLNRRAAYKLDIDDVIAAAARNDTWLELNASPDRLDIDDLTCMEARKHGVKVSVATDAHSVAGLDFMRFGVNQARRGWLEKGDVVNTMTYRSLKSVLRTH